MPDLDTKEKLEAIPGTPPNMIYPPKGDAFAERNAYAMKIDFEMQPPAVPHFAHPLGRHLAAASRRAQGGPAQSGDGAYCEDEDQNGRSEANA